MCNAQQIGAVSSQTQMPFYTRSGPAGDTG